ncbi:MAG TPA: LamG-like jellyroll fold domain-containing protein [Methylomirabilota bacterium]|nr:LamG-like jellyroll fold domain-containing protein [Methylomirabilota bacterium]
MHYRLLLVISLLLLAPLSLRADSDLALLITPVVVEEGNSGSQVVAFNVQTTHRPTSSWSYHYATISGAAVAGIDFRSVSGVHTFSSTNTNTVIHVEILGDAISEPDENFHLAFYADTNRTIMRASYGTAIIKNDDHPEGQLNHFQVVLSTNPVAGKPIEATIIAVNAAGARVSNYTGWVNLSIAASPTPTSPVLISEVDVTQTDSVEFVNVSDQAIDVSGWRIDIYDEESYPFPWTHIVRPASVLEAGQVFRLDEAFTQPSIFPVLRSDEPLFWFDLPGAKAAVVLRSAEGKLMDAFFAGSARPEHAYSPAGDLAFSWSGPSAFKQLFMAQTFQRQGAADTDTTNDWILATRTLNAPHPTLAVPFTTSITMPISPATVFLQQGQWSGSLLLPEARLKDAFLLVKDGDNMQGTSAQLHLQIEDDLSIAVQAPATIPTGGELRVALVVSNSGPTALTGAIITNFFSPSLKLISITGGAPIVTNSMNVALLLPTLSGGETQQVEFTFLSSVPGTVLNTATITHPTRDPWPYNNSATSIVEIVPDCTTLPPGLIAWWRGEGNLRDQVSTRELQSAGSAQFVRGKVGDAFALAGGAAVIPSSSELFFGPEEGFSIVAWVKPAATSSTTIFERAARDSTTTRFEGWRFYVTGSTIGFQLSTSMSDTAPVDAVATLPSLLDGNFHHFALVADRGFSALGQIYVDGVMVKEFSLRQHLDMMDPPAPAKIGGAGLLDEIAIFRGALSESTLKGISQAGAAGYCANDLTIALQARAASSIAAIPAPHVVRIVNYSAAPATNVAVVVHGAAVAFSDAFAPSGTLALADGRLTLTNAFVDPFSSIELSFTATFPHAGSNRIDAELVSGTPNTSTLNDRRSIFGHALPACDPSAGSMIAWWRGEANGAEETGLAHATNITATYSAGYSGQAFTFNGEEQFVEVPSRPELNFPGASFSIEAWIQPSIAGGASEYRSIVDKRVVNGDRATGYVLAHIGDVIAFQLTDSDQSAPATTFHTPRTAIFSSGFHHVVVSVNRNAFDGGAIYVDGERVQTFNPLVEPLSIANPAPLRIGRLVPNTVVGQFRGQIDEVALHHKALTAEDVARIYARKQLPRCITPNLATADSDRDNLPDLWELAYGLDPAQTTPAAHDADGDGVTTHHEYLSGTDPNSRLSFLAIEQTRLLEDKLEIEARVVVGRSYTLESASTLSPASWQQLALPKESTSNVIRFQVPTDTSRAFYRLRSN